MSCVKIHFLILFSLLFSWQANSQEKGTHEIYAGVGLLTTNDALSLGSNMMADGYTSSSHLSYGNNRYIPAFGLGYKLAVADRWTVGVAGYFESDQSDVYYDNMRDGTLRHSYFTIGLGTDYHYISRKWFQMYSGLEVACTIGGVNYDGVNEEIQESKYRYFNFQLEALGFRFGKSFAFFTEIGFGYKGVIHAGLSLQL
ncbi:MAG: uncharacterized protein K0S23_1607 [Fluviicola sp.]|jgi:hypothetical protein|uniref:transporter n=1 Tax=Fluviicola sp. TaxID=1917219 RepID=UPI00262D7D34|nr:transporter [Fluviicola sp.]MDF3027300.1 uncharacterized protein [Fluviicola sp.]